MKKRKIENVVNPMIGDIYTIREEENHDYKYYFLRIAGISKDSVIVLHNRLDYGDFVSSLSRDDYFVKNDTLVYSRKQIKKMLESDEIYSIDRDYGEGSNFNQFN